MMTVKYRREMNRNYMVIRAERDRGGRYAEKMLTENQIPGLLSFYEKRVDDQMWFYYDITSRQPLSRILESRALTGPEIRRLISDLLYTLKQMERFLMDEGQLSLNPEHIYVEPDTFQSFLCLIPGEYKSFSEEFGGFAKYLLDHVNHMDTEAVVLSFGIFRESQKANFGMESVERIINQDVKISAEKSIPEQRGDLFEKDTDDLEREEELAVYREPLMSSVNEQKAAGKNTDGKGQIAATGLLISVMLLLPAGVVLLQGISALLRYKWMLAGIEGCLLVMILTLKRAGDDKQECEEKIEQKTAQKTVGQASSASRVSNKVRIEDWEDILRRADEPDAKEEELQTVLLTAGFAKEESRRFVPVSGGEEILIPYFPFIIGKSRELSDFCLDAPGVSRLHLRIDEKENGYTVTDLNSTNGTQVDKKTLQANESCSLAEGAVVKIAGLVYRFL